MLLTLEARGVPKHAHQQRLDALAGILGAEVECGGPGRLSTPMAHWVGRPPAAGPFRLPPLDGLARGIA
jgi:hypothetical protein